MRRPKETSSVALANPGQAWGSSTTFGFLQGATPYTLGEDATHPKRGPASLGFLSEDGRYLPSLEALPT